MTGGFMVHIRGIRIDVKKTLDKYYNDKKELYTINDFKKYLETLGLNDKYNKKNYDTKTPINDGFVSVLEFDDINQNETNGFIASFLTTGIWEYQHWVLQKWTDTKQQLDFFNPKYLSKKIEISLKNKWNDKLIFAKDDKLGIYAIAAEWCVNYNKTKKGGGFYQLAKSDDYSLHTNINDNNINDNYIKNKSAYIFIKNR